MRALLISGYIFLGLGDLISLAEGATSKIFLGGLSEKDGDGESAYVWLDDAMQVNYLIVQHLSVSFTRFINVLIRDH